MCWTAPSSLSAVQTYVPPSCSCTPSKTMELTVVRIWAPVIGAPSLSQVTVGVGVPFAMHWSSLVFPWWNMTRAGGVLKNLGGPEEYKKKETLSSKARKDFLEGFLNTQWWYESIIDAFTKTKSRKAVHFNLILTMILETNINLINEISK